MRDLPPDVFEIRLHRDEYGARTLVEVWSRMYEIRLGFALRHNWDGDPRELSDFIDSFIGGTVRSWYENRVGVESGRDMARALMPHWEREIHRRMESIEYRARRRPIHMNVRYDDRIDGLRFNYANYDEWGSWGPKEDPKAKERARQLLMRNLDDGQEKSFKKDGSFRVTAKDGKVYTIKTARSFNVEGPDGTKYCGQLKDTPVEDQMLAQKLLLEHEPEKFFKNANVSPAQTTDSPWLYVGALRPGSIIGLDTSA